MQNSSTALVPTDNASKYLQQLCKHWSHNLAVDFTAEQGRIVFPRDARGADWPGDGLVTMIAHDDTLECRIEASAAGQLDGLKGALARHLDRFAFREAPLRFDWQDDRPG
ncbi:DUF2218 domain-containing protein [Flavisphingomonas formosensis]|uniref:DUF2218 domain-containing protein n=1 Tax=Flavisphingomonas formosensis TaxID=861534 RepID=UPI0012FB8E69|nr:DUF2218 domain-containing protein [Sphingomonas formosensis]